MIILYHPPAMYIVNKSKQHIPQYSKSLQNTMMAENNFGLGASNANKKTLYRNKI